MQIERSVASGLDGETDPGSPAAGSLGLGEGSKRRAWALLAVVLLVTAAVHLPGIGTWPWDIDEVSTLLEVGVLDPGVQPRPASPDSMVLRITRLLPVWYAAQGTLLRVVPVNELTARLLPVTCGILAVVLVFGFGLRQRGLLFALALVVLLDGSQLVVWLSQQNRFYGMALLLLVLTITAIWSKASGLGMVLLCGLCGLVAVLSHSLLVVVFGLGMVAACVAYPLGWMPKSAFIGAVTAGVVAALVFLLYVRPIVGGWTGVGLAWTHPFVSFVGHVGVPTVALALFGSVACLTDRVQRREAGWWAVFAAGSLLFVAMTPWVMPAWNARYAVLFALPIWITAALGVERIAVRLASPQKILFWYGCVAMLLAPKLISHYLDGTRHDLRAAARIVAAEAQADEPICSNMTLRTKYYLPDALRGKVVFWNETTDLPPAECLVVYASNIWDPLPCFPGRRAEILAQIGRRRLDELSHVVRVYRVGRTGSRSGQRGKATAGSKSKT